MKIDFLDYRRSSIGLGRLKTDSKIILLEDRLGLEEIGVSKSLSASHSFQNEGPGNEQQSVTESFYPLFHNPFIF